MRRPELPGVLRSRDFSLLFAGQAVSLLGDGFFQIALAFAVLDISSDRAALGYVLAAGSLPLVAFILIGGVWADRLPRQRLMLAADGARMAIQGLLGFLVISGQAQIWHLLALNVLYGSAMAFFQPAATGLIPQLVEGEQLEQANGLLGMTRSVMMIVGGGLGGVVVDQIGSGGAILADSATFAASAACLLAMRAAPVAGGDREPFLRELRAGWREVRSRRWLWLTIGSSAVFLTLYVAPLEVVGPIIAKSELGGATAWGLINMSFAVGMTAGGLVAMTRRLSYPMRVSGVLFTITAVSPLMLAIPAPLPLIMLSFLVEGAAVGLFITTYETAMQRDVPPEALSRVSAWDWMGSLAGMPIGLALAGSVIGAFGTRATLVGMAMAGAVLSTLWLGSPDIRSIGARELDGTKLR